MTLIAAGLVGALLSSLIEVALFFVFRKRIAANMEAMFFAPRRVESAKTNSTNALTNHYDDEDYVCEDEDCACYR